jgi:holo-[acyl-carrier protein] synthase
MNVIGIGTEIIECVRIARMIEQHGELFLERVFTPDEVSYCTERSSATQHFAARWAAKEAVMKAIMGRSRGIRWTEIEVLVKPHVGPSVRLLGRAADWATQRGIDRFQLSLGHCRTHATAFVIAMNDT